MTVGIIGLGYVGLPLAVAFAEAGEQVVGVDLDQAKVDALRAGASYIHDVSDAALRSAAGRLQASTDYGALAGADAIVICVPTPLNEGREPDMSHLDAAASALAPLLRAGHVVVLESTSYPGTTRDRVLPLLEHGSGLVAGRDFHLAYSPERIDPGRTDYTLRTTPKVVGGLTEQCSARASELYGRVCDRLVPVSSPDAAELTKLLENIYRAVNIALVNELWMLSDRMGIDIREVVEAAATKPFGFTRFDPGPGMGGHCMPVDPFYLAWRARHFDFFTEFIEAAGKVNQQMPYWCVARIERALSDAGHPTRGARVSVFGLSYKSGLGDTRESPGIKIASLLHGRGAIVRYHDPYIVEVPALGLRSVTFDEALDADVAVIATAHPGVDHQRVAREVLTVDLRGVIR